MNTLYHHTNTHYTGEHTGASFSKWQYALWFLLFCVSGVVYFEPAPFDLFSLILLPLFLLFGLRIPSGLSFFLVCIGLFLSASLMSSILAPTITEATRHIMITGFLAVVGFFVACVLSSTDRQMAHLLWQGWVCAALIATLTGIVGFLELVPGAEMFTRYGRAMGTFKDPNLFGPFLVPPAIYAFMRFMRDDGLKRLFYLAVLAVLSVGVLLSLSRAALGHYVISLLIAMAAILVSPQDHKERGRLISFTIIAGILSVVGLSVLLNIDQLASLIETRFSLSQSYDSGGQGRFDGQGKAIELIMQNPFGIGANVFLRYWPEAPHNVYLTNFLSGGWIAGFSYIALILVTLATGLKGAFNQTPQRFHMIIAGSSFVGVALVGFVVDTDHWRHFFVLLGVIWGLHLSKPTSAN